MTYRVKYTDLTKNPILVQDGDVDTTTNLGLVGRGYTGFGEVVAENFLHLLENFADETPPTRPTPGQMWYDNNNSVLYYYTIADTWKKVGDVRTAATAPTTLDGEVTGDFWLNTATNDLYMYNDPSWVLMTNGDITTKVYTRTRKDTALNLHKTLEMVVNGEIVAIFSGDSGDNTIWVPNSDGINAEKMDNGTYLATMYPTIRLGLNLIDRKTITEVTVATTNPTLENQYLRTGDLWVNSSSGRLFSFDGSAWNRLNSYVKVRAAVPVIENDEQTGDIWINTLIGKLYYYNSTTATWDILGVGTTFATVNPVDGTDIKNIGDYWVNAATQQLYIFDGTSWIQLTFQEKGTFERSRIIKDINNVNHKVLETIINEKTVSISSSDDVSWKPSPSETLYENIAYNTYFPRIAPGINMSQYVGEISTTVTAGSAPASPSTYAVWIDNTLLYPANIKVYNGATWIAPSNLYDQVTTPSVLAIYNYWVNPSTKKMFVYNGTIWVEKTPIYSNGVDPGGSQYDIWIDNSNIYPDNIKIRNNAAAWVAPANLYSQTTTPTSLAIYNYWKNSYTLDVQIYNGSGWQTVTPTSTGSISRTNYSTPRVLYGISTHNAISGGYAKIYTSNTITNTYSDIYGMDVYLTSSNWSPSVKGTVIIDASLTSITGYDIRVVRHPIDSYGNYIPGSSTVVAESNYTQASIATATARTITLSFVDPIFYQLYRYYDINQQGPFNILYAIQMKKTGTTLTTSGSVIDMDVLYHGDPWTEVGSATTNPPEWWYTAGFN